MTRLRCASLRRRALAAVLLRSGAAAPNVKERPGAMRIVVRDVHTARSFRLDRLLRCGDSRAGCVSIGVGERGRRCRGLARPAFPR